MHEREIFRPKSGLFLSGCVVLLCACFIWSAAATNGLATAISWSLAVIDCTYLILIRPKVIFTEESLTIINPIEEVTIGWGDIELVDAKWCMSISSKHGRFNAWAAPAPSRHHSKKIHPSELKAMEIAGRESISPARSPESDSGIAVHMAQLRIATFHGASTEFSRQRNWIATALLGLSFAAALVFSAIGL